MFINGRYWGLRYHVLVVKQTPEGMVVISRHRLLDVAKKKAQELANKSELFHAALVLIGNPRNDYQPGDVLDGNDVWWQGGIDHATVVKRSCSECLQQCIPTSLEYHCYNRPTMPVCDVVACHRLKAL